MRRLIALLIALALTANPAFANDFYNASGVPSTGAPIVSSTIRNEFANIGTAFNKMPGLTGNGNSVVIVNAGGTALTTAAATALLGMAIGTNLEAWSAQLDALSALGTTGLISRTAANTFATRTITGTAAEITVTNGDGVAGAPTLSLPSSLTFSGKTITGGSYVSPALGTPASGVMTNVTGTAAGLTAGNVTTNANLTGPITSVGNATSVAAQTGTGTTFVMQASPTLTTPNIGVATATTVNKVTLTAPASSATLTIADGKTHAVNNSITLAGVDGKTLTTNNSLTLAGTDATTITFQASDTYVGRATTDTLTNKTITTLVNSGTITIPTGTDTLVGRATTDTLTNKTHTNPANTDQTLTMVAGGTTTWDMNSGGIATLTLTGGNTTLGAPSNMKKGTYILHVIQDGTGSRLITWNAVFKWPSAVAPTLSTGINKRDIITFISDGTNMYGPPAPLLDVR